MHLSCLQAPLRTLVFTALLYLFAPSPAQAQSPYLYASIPGGATTSLVVGFSVAPDGTLSQVPGPFNLSSEGGLITTDPSDQFLFVLNAKSNTISVLSINPITGALTEVSASPVMAPIDVPGGGGLNPYSPISMATLEGTAPNPSYLLVAYQKTTSAASFSGAVVAFQIKTTGLPLIPTVQTNLEAIPTEIVTSSHGYLYALQSAPGFSGVGVFTIDPASGALNPESSQGGIHLSESSVAINAQETMLFDGWGGASGGIESSAVEPDGSLPSSPASVVSLQGSSSPPSSMVVDGSGRLLYVQQGGQAVAYVVDASTGALSPTQAVIPFSVSPVSVIS